METLSQRFEATRHQVGDAWTTFFQSTYGAVVELGKSTDAARAKLLSRTQTAAKRFGTSTRSASQTFVKQTSTAAAAFADETRAASEQLGEALVELGRAWQQLPDSTAMVKRLQAPAGVTEITRQGLSRSLEMERAALEGLRTLLYELDVRLEHMLESLDAVPANQAEFLLPAGYDELSARKISTECAHWTHAELVAALTHEQQTKERATVLGALERRLEGLAEAS